MKTVSKELNDPFREKLFAIIYVRFWDYHRDYKEFKIVASNSFLSKMNDDCKRILKNDCEYKNSVYIETINLAFRPRVRITDFCTSVIKYICCSLNIKEFINEYPNQQFKIDARIDVENSKLSEVIIVPQRNTVVLGENDIIPKLLGYSDFLMPLKFRLEYLKKEEAMLLSKLSDIIHQSNHTHVRFSLDQLLNLLEWSYIDDIEDDPVCRILDSLQFYNFISVDTEDRYSTVKHKPIRYFIISINESPAEINKRSIENYNGPGDEDGDEDNLPF
jgi:hypothetical protein